MVKLFKLIIGLCVMIWELEGGIGNICAQWVPNIQRDTL